MMCYRAYIYTHQVLPQTWNCGSETRHVTVSVPTSLHWVPPHVMKQSILIRDVSFFLKHANDSYNQPHSCELSNNTYPFYLRKEPIFLQVCGFHFTGYSAVFMTCPLADRLTINVKSYQPQGPTSFHHAYYLTFCTSNGTPWMVHCPVIALPERPNAGY